MTCAYQQPIIGHILGEVGEDWTFNGLDVESHDQNKIESPRSSNMQEFVPRFAAWPNLFPAGASTQGKTNISSKTSGPLPKSSCPLPKSWGTEQESEGITFESVSVCHKAHANKDQNKQAILRTNHSTALRPNHSLQTHGSYNMADSNHRSGSKKSHRNPTSKSRSNDNAGGDPFQFFLKEYLPGSDGNVVVKTNNRVEKRGRAVLGDVGEVKDQRPQFYFNSVVTDDGFGVFGNMSAEAAQRLDSVPRSETSRSDVPSSAGTFSNSPALGPLGTYEPQQQMIAPPKQLAAMPFGQEFVPAVQQTLREPVAYVNTWVPVGSYPSFPTRGPSVAYYNHEYYAHPMTQQQSYYPPPDLRYEQQRRR